MNHDLAIFEAGISLPGEMEHLEPIISPTIGIFTNIGHAHDEYFEDQRQKAAEKLKLFTNASILVYCADYTLITDCLHADSAYQNLKTFTWGRHQKADLRIVTVTKENGQTRITAEYKAEIFNLIIPFTDEASIENAIHCLATEIILSSPLSCHPPIAFAPLSRYDVLAAIAMRLELKEAINHCSLINDSYNSDINSLSIGSDGTPGIDALDQRVET